MSESLNLCTSSKMQPIRDLISKVASTNTTVLLRGESGEAPQDLVDWWTRFQDASPAEREAMLKPDEAPKKRRRSRRGRKRRAEAVTSSEDAAPPAGGDR